MWAKAYSNNKNGKRVLSSVYLLLLFTVHDKIGNFVTVNSSAIQVTIWSYGSYLSSAVVCLSPILVSRILKVLNDSCCKEVVLSVMACVGTAQF